MNTKRSAVVACIALTLVTGCLTSNTAVHAQTSQDIDQLVIHAKTPADHQSLVRWYEGREAKARNEARLYRKIASAYRGSHEPQQKAITACEQIATYFEDVAQHLEILAEEHRHMAAHQQ